MSISLLLASALLASPATHVVASPADTDRVEVAYDALRAGRNDAAIAQLRASGLAADGDTAALINMGTAYARLGRPDAAMACFKAAMASTTRYDLQLADGSWVDSRLAARRAAEALDRSAALAMR